MKIALIRYRKVLRASAIEEAKKKLHYDKIIFLCEICKPSEKDLQKEKKVAVYTGKRKEFPALIKRIYEEHERAYFLLPFFTGDNNGKFNIQIYNRSFDTKFPWKVFKEKSDMNAFLGDVIEKKNQKFSYAELQEMSFDTLQETLGGQCILKPLNASSSVMSSRVSSAAEFEAIKPKLQKKYRYIAEEYMTGNLYSMDFFFDGKNIFFLCYAREMFFGEILQKLKKSAEITEYPPEFFYFLPVRYTIDLQKVSSAERQFVEKLGKKLKEGGYRGFVHLEYRYDKAKKKIGFIEWGARPGGYRRKYVQEMHHVYMDNLPAALLMNGDKGQFLQKNGCFFLRGRDVNKNFITIKANVREKTHIMNILRKNSEKYLEVSFQKFLKDLLWDTWKVKVKEIGFQVKTSSDFYLYPLHERSDTRFSYTMEMDEKNFERFLTKKYSILDRLIFHEYGGKKKGNVEDEGDMD